MARNYIHRTAVVADSVTLGTGNTIGPYAVLVGRTVLGDDNWIGPHVCIGAPPEVYSYEHRNVWEEVDEQSQGIRIGSRNRVHEFASIQSGWAGQTVVGNDCFVMTKSHIGHDCVLDDKVTMSVSATLGGHTHVWSNANIGMLAVVHQKLQVGPGAMIGMASAVRKTAPAFAITVGNPARTTGINVVGLQRNGCPEELIPAMTDYLLGRSDLPAGVDPNLGGLLTAWQAAQA